MEITFLKQCELKKARKRWQWAYFIAYANALLGACYGFVITDDAGHTALGFDPAYTTGCLVFGIMLAALAWGIQKKLSLICMSLFLLIVILNGIFASSDEENVKDVIGSVITALILFRGTLGVREMKKVVQEHKR